MIFVHEATNVIEGDFAHILAETTIMLKSLRKCLTEKGIPIERADALIERCLTQSRWSREELDAALETAIKNFLVHPAEAENQEVKGDD